MSWENLKKEICIFRLEIIPDNKIAISESLLDWADVDGEAF